MRTIIGIVVLAAGVTGAYLLNKYTRGADGKSLLHVAPPLEVAVETALPEQRLIVRTVQAPGEVEAFAEVDIRSEVVAKILEMPVEEGDYVQAGQLLCRLDDADYKARVLSAEAGAAKLRSLIVQAQADLDNAERDWDQQQRLRETAATSEMELARYRAALVKARAVLEMRQHELREAEAALQAAQQALAKTVIKAPIAGVVSQRFAKAGEVVITGTMNNPGTRIMVVTDLSQMQVRCRVDEADAALVAPDQPARIFLQSDTRKSVAGRVLRVGTKGTKPLGRDVVTFETLVLVTGQDASVRPGMTANVEIEVARRDNALTIPVQAVVYRRRRDLPEDLVQEFDHRPGQPTEAARPSAAEYLRVVFCVRDNQAHPRLVQVGVSDATGVEILGGLTADDTIAIGPYRSLDQLKDGSAVKIEQKPAKSATQAARGDEPPDADQAQATTTAPTTQTAAASGGAPAGGTDPQQ